MMLWRNALVMGNCSNGKRGEGEESKLRLHGPMRFYPSFFAPKVSIAKDGMGEMGGAGIRVLYAGTVVEVFCAGKEGILLFSLSSEDGLLESTDLFDVHPSRAYGKST